MPSTASAKSRASELIARSTIEYHTDPQASLRDSNEALRILQTLEDVDLSILAHLQLCHYQYEHDPKAAAVEVDLLETLLPRVTNAGLQAGIFLCEADVRQQTGDHVAARSLLEKAVRAATAAHDDQRLGAALRSLGHLLGLRGELASGLSDLREAQAIFERIEDQWDLLPTLSNIAIIYNRMGDFAAAKHIYSRVREAERTEGAGTDLAVTTHNLGRACESLNEWSEAREAYNESLTVSQRIGYQRGIAYALRGLGSVELATGDSTGALATLERSDALQKQFSDARLHAQIAMARGAALHRLGRLTDSIASLREAIDWFRSADTLSDLAGAEAELAATYGDSGDWRAAFRSEADYAKATEQLTAGRLDQRFTALKVEYDTAAKERENAELVRINQVQQEQIESRRRMHLMTSGLVGAALLSSALLAGLLYSDSRRRLAIARQASVLRTLTHNLSDTVMLLDPAQRVQFANRPLPGGRSEMIGLHLREVVPVAAAESMSRQIADAVRERNACTFDACWPAPDGTPLIFEQRITPVLEGGRLIGVTLQSSEVTDRRRFEDALRLEAQILDAMNEGVIVINASERIVFANSAMHLLLGYADGDLQGETLSSLQPDESVRELWARLLGSVALSEEELYLRRQDGSNCLVSLASSPLGGRAGRLLICVCRDISDRRRVERAIAGTIAREAAGVGSTLHENLAQELAGISLLLAGLTRELNGKEAAGNFHAARGYLAAAIRTARELAGVVSPTAPVRGSLDQALASLCDELRSRLGVPVLFEAPPHAADIEMTIADQLYRVVRDTVDNAVERRRCDTITLALSVVSGIARVSIQWTGPLRAPIAIPSHLAWDLIAYRVRLIGGTFECEDPSEGGGSVTVSAPVSITAENARYGPS